MTLKVSILEGDKRIFQDLVLDVLLENIHRTTGEMYPSKAMEDNQLQVSSHEATPLWSGRVQWS